MASILKDFDNFFFKLSPNYFSRYTIVDKTSSSVLYKLILLILCSSCSTYYIGMYYLYCNLKKMLLARPHRTQLFDWRIQALWNRRHKEIEKRASFINSQIQTCKYANNLDQTSEIRTADIFQKMQKFPSSEKGKKRKEESMLVYFNGALLVFFPHIYFSHFFSHSGIGKELENSTAAGLFALQNFKVMLDKRHLSPILLLFELS